MTLGLPHLHERVIGSTNERARELGALGAPHGTLVTADEQLAGRGRQGRSWTAAPGEALLMSLLLRDLTATSLVPLAAAVAVCEACEALTRANCMLKWPNDVWIGGRKVAGILIEGRPQEGWAVLGLGLNVSTRTFPPPLDATATSLALAGAAPSVDVGAARVALVGRLGEWLARDAGAILDAWRARDALRGSEVRWGDQSGVAAGIDSDGSLQVDTTHGRVGLSSGEVHLGSA